MAAKFASSSFTDFSHVLELYRSQSGVVYRGTFKYDRKDYVLKERKLPELGRAKDIMNEIKLLLQLNHQNVLRCEGWFRDEQRGSIFMVLELCGGGDLNSIIQQRHAKMHWFEERQVWFIFLQLCEGVRHLHEHGIIHRDLKPLNVFCSANGRTFKIGDLGVSEDTMLLKSFYGTPLYLSPELVESKPYNEKTDIWSLGVILFELCALSPPFQGSSLLEVARMVAQGLTTSSPAAIPKHFSQDMQRCISWMLNVNYVKRPNIAQVIEYVSARLSGKATHAPQQPAPSQQSSHHSPDRDRRVRTVAVDPPSSSAVDPPSSSSSSHRRHRHRRVKSSSPFRGGTRRKSPEGGRRPVGVSGPSPLVDDDCMDADSLDSGGNSDGDDDDDRSDCTSVTHLDQEGG